MVKQPWTVADLTHYIQMLLTDDEALRDVWVEGEVSNFLQHTSGHCYFSLKDAHATLQCVMWKSYAALLPEPPQDGQHVLAHGRIDIYPPRGTYQLYVDYLQPAGMGDLYAQFEALKARLAAEGLFDDARKRPLPRWPRRIGVVTSPDGAALRDIVRVIRSRYPDVDLILSPTLVQGAEAPGQIVTALQALIDYGHVDVILVARGGGSLEDLWAFNDERVARAIAASPVPVVSGVGHETDFTIADFVADVRAPTPSAAAMAVVPDGQELRRQLRAYQERLRQALASYVSAYRKRLAAEVRALRLHDPRLRLATARQHVDDLHRSLHHAWQVRLAFWRTRVQGLEARLQSLDPRQVLRRGYALVERVDNTPVTSITAVSAGEHIRVILHDGHLEAWVVDQVPRQPARRRNTP